MTNLVGIAPFVKLQLIKISVENGSDMVITIIYHLLQEFIKDHGKLPKKLHLNLGKFKKLETVS